LESPSAFSGGWAWFAPVMACCLAMMVISSARTNQIGYLSGRQPTDWLTTVASNQSYAAYIASDFHSEQNALQKEPIELTREVHHPTDPRIGPLLATNSLMH
jgi:hypothetical protein